jgi:hypothetical protein
VSNTQIQRTSIAAQRTTDGFSYRPDGAISCTTRQRVVRIDTYRLTLELLSDRSLLIEDTVVAGAPLVTGDEVLLDRFGGRETYLDGLSRLLPGLLDRITRVIVRHCDLLQGWLDNQ